ncbi:MAG: hypothetical protein HYY18_10380 [Planctomycetes bacterium]|nr:hypothetical protein [Planctomycetota bacterium]
MPVSVGCLFFAFAFTTVVAGLHQKLRTPSWLVFALTPVLVALYLVAMMAMPFAGFLTELPLVLLATVAASGPVTLMIRANESLKAKREAGGHVAEFRGDVMKQVKSVGKGMMFGALLFLPVMAMTLFSLVSRINYACWLGWKCDGRIVSVTRDGSNHQAPMILVETGGRTDSFSQVDDGFWKQAKAGMHLTKKPGSPMATLDGRPVRMVPLQLKWWNDAK